MMLMISAFIAAMLFLLFAAKEDAEDEEMANELESRLWIIALADESRRRKPRARGKYSASGLWRKGGCRP